MIQRRVVMTKMTCMNQSSSFSQTRITQMQMKKWLSKQTLLSINTSSTICSNSQKRSQGHWSQTHRTTYSRLTTTTILSRANHNRFYSQPGCGRPSLFFPHCSNALLVACSQTLTQRTVRVTQIIGRCSPAAWTLTRTGTMDSRWTMRILLTLHCHILLMVSNVRRVLMSETGMTLATSDSAVQSGFLFCQ